MACDNPACPVGLCCTTLYLERGWYARMQIYALDGSNASSAEAGQIFAQMDQSAPSQITDLQTTTTTDDGRHRSFTWTVPRENGQPIIAYVLRRLDAAASYTQYDYWFQCDDAGARPCSSAAFQCWPAGFSCTGTYDDAYKPNYSGGAVSITLGSDIDKGDGSYLTPEASYQWKVPPAQPPTEPPP